MARDFFRIYARSEYMTPGAARTVDVIAQKVRPDESTWLLDVPCGKAEAAAALAGRFACRVVGVDIYDAFIHYAAAKVWFFNLRDLVSIVRGDARQVPVRDGAFDVACCIGGPSIPGVDLTLHELARAVRPGGWVIVSDIVWRVKPEEPLDAEWKWVAGIEPKLSCEEYAARIEAADLRVEESFLHPRSDWDEYWRPMLEVAEEAKLSQPADIGFADEVESDVALERRSVEQFLDYATFAARKPAP